MATGIQLDLGLVFIGMVLPFWAVMGGLVGLLITVSANPAMVEMVPGKTTDFVTRPVTVVGASSWSVQEGIGRHQGEIVSVASPDRPDGFKARGLCCGFVKVTKPLKPGQIVRLKDKHRTIKVEIVDNIRPDRTARKPLAKFIGK